jgi:hypothetical protein
MRRHVIMFDMTVILPSELADAVEAASRESGVPATELVCKALRAHFPPIEPELQAEFEAWDAVSDAAMRRVDQMLGDTA